MENSRFRNVLLIFVKNPVKGRVKTRLAESIGDQRALEVYRQLLKITKRETIEVSAEKQVWYSSDTVDGDIWDAPDYSKYRQEGRNLGERMQYAFKENFKNGCRKAVIIGSDCPYITTDIIHRAFAGLDEHDLVVGPSEDGGYYLLGMKKYRPDLFRDKPWGSSFVLEQTMSDARKQGLETEQLPVLNDIDTLQDLQAVAKDIYL